jgi:hypothetical protein
LVELDLIAYDTLFLHPYTTFDHISSSISKFEGGWLRPTRLMSGKAIVEKYGQKSVEEGLRRFYSQNQWRHLLQVFEDAVDFTHKMSGQ